MRQTESKPPSRRFAKGGSPPPTASRRRPRRPDERRKPSPYRKRVTQIAGLVDELLEQLGGLPIKTIVHGWPTEPAKEFLRRLAAVLRPIDSFMLIPDESAGRPMAADLDRAFVVNFTKESHQRMYLNTSYDIGFFPSLNANEEIPQLHKLNERVRVLVIDNRGSAAPQMLLAGREADFVIFEWSGGDTLVTYNERADDFSRASHVSETSGSQHYRQFSGRFQPFKKPDRLYVPLEILPGGLRRSLVWRPILDCIPDQYYRQGDDVYGVLVEVSARANATVVIKSIAKVFDETVDDEGYLSESAFVGGVAEAMTRVEDLKPKIGKKLDLRSKPLESRKALLMSIGVGVGVEVR